MASLITSRLTMKCDRTVLKLEEIKMMQEKSVNHKSQKRTEENMEKKKFVLQTETEFQQ